MTGQGLSFLSEHQLTMTNSGFRVGNHAHSFADQMRRLALVALVVVLAVSPCVAAEKDAMSDHDDTKLTELAHYLLPGDSSFVEEVRLAIEHPDAYVATFSKRLAERGIRKPTDAYVDIVERAIRKPKPLLPWIAIVDGLNYRGRLVEIGARESLEEMAWNIDKLLTDQPKEPNRWAWLANAEWSGKYPEQVFPEVGARLSEKGLCLMWFVIYSDSSPLIVLPIDQVEKAMRLAVLAGYDLISWAPPSSSRELAK